jgi:exodeoxyribonuclease V alpha subunit
MTQEQLSLFDSILDDEPIQSSGVVASGVVAPEPATRDIQPPDFRPLERMSDLFLLLDRWVERGWLRALDRAFVAFLYELDGQSDPSVMLAAALTSHQLGHGHVCLDLAEILGNPDMALSLPPEGDEERQAVLLPSEVLAVLDVTPWLKALESSPIVAIGKVDDCPLVLDGKRLYLRRYWGYERRVSECLQLRLSNQSTHPDDLCERLANLFPERPVIDGKTVTDWQKLACALSARGAFSIITGGPGTGKTTTVVRLLALLQAPAVEQGSPIRIRLAAPTGKAAARLTESIGRQVQSLEVAEAVRPHIPVEVTTVHRLLGSRPDTRHFRHHISNPLPLDVLVVDEASMIDLEMMACLLDALPPQARLILLGDKDQLASVEAGAVLGDLCRDAESGYYTPQTRAWLEEICGECLSEEALEDGHHEQHALAQQVVMLRHSRRFNSGSGIGQLARHVNLQDASSARALLAQKAYSDLFCQRLRDADDKKLETLVLDGHGPEKPHGYRHYLTVMETQRPSYDLPIEDPAWEAWAKAVLDAFDEFQLLCAVRKGPWGVEGLNQRIAKALLGAKLISHDQGWYEGRPVLVTRNDYSLNLMNGDIGIALCMPEPANRSGKAIRVAFPRNDGSGGLRFILPSRLSAVETVFAMTVHKSQGSEFAHTALVLPEAISPVLTKELIYTGITRARNWFSLIESRPGVFEEAVSRRVRRLSGLMLT